VAVGVELELHSSAGSKDARTWGPLHGERKTRRGAKESCGR
jgi:hypothetical protein